ncbi:phage late control D family protein [Brevibacillus sp. H7]|uniref:phage late control D family protein n=1 Tax=Brevibacillus sp. H7 TaxID=3349138 RepID=UPI00381E06DC
MNGRKAWLQVKYENKDISTYLQPYLLSWSYTDNLSGQADDLQLTLEDTNQLWSGAWMPEKGNVIQGVIMRQDWEKHGITNTLPIGQFEIDEIEVGGPPSVATIKAISVPESSSLRGERKNRAWEKTFLSVIARDIASKAKLKLMFQTSEDPEYDRIEQTDEYDLAFLMRLCNDAGLCLKVTGKQLVIFDEEDLEKKAPVATLRKGDPIIKSYQGRTSLNGLYKACRVEYYNARKKQTIKYTYTPPKPPKTGRVLVINQRVSSQKEAIRLAKKRLRQENKNATVFSITLLGDTRFVAGLTVNLSGFGKFDGKYIITQAAHGQQSGYETKLELRRCLEGY